MILTMLYLIIIRCHGIWFTYVRIPICTLFGLSSSSKKIRVWSDNDLNNNCEILHTVMAVC